MFYMIYFKFKKYCFFTCVAVGLIFTKLHILSRTLIGNLYKPTKNLEKYWETKETIERTTVTLERERAKWPNPGCL